MRSFGCSLFSNCNFLLETTTIILNRIRKTHKMNESFDLNLSALRPLLLNANPLFVQEQRRTRQHHTGEGSISRNSSHSVRQAPLGSHIPHGSVLPPVELLTKCSCRARTRCLVPASCTTGAKIGQLLFLPGSVFDAVAAAGDNKENCGAGVVRRSVPTCRLAKYLSRVRARVNVSLDPGQFERDEEGETRCCDSSYGPGLARKPEVPGRSRHHARAERHATLMFGEKPPVGKYLDAPSRIGLRLFY